MGETSIHIKLESMYVCEETEEEADAKCFKRAYDDGEYEEIERKLRQSMESTYVYYDITFRKDLGRKGTYKVLRKSGSFEWIIRSYVDRKNGDNANETVDIEDIENMTLNQNLSGFGTIKSDGLVRRRLLQ